MRGSLTVPALMVFLASVPIDSLLVQKINDPVTLQLAKGKVDSATASAIGQAHPTEAPTRADNFPCGEGGCSFLDSESTGKKTLQQKLKKRMKKLKKAIAKQKKEFLQGHTQEEYKVLTLEAKLEALREANATREVQSEEPPQKGG